MLTKPYYELDTEVLAKTDPVLIEYQIQQWVSGAPGTSGTMHSDVIAKTAVASANEIVYLRKKLKATQSSDSDEWWKTFRSALTGLLANGREFTNDAREKATRLADNIHGKLSDLK